MPINAEALGVHLGLLLEKSQCPPRGKCAKEPRAIPRRLDGIQRPRTRLDAYEIVCLISARGMVGIERAPVSGELVIRVTGFPFPEKFHDIGIHFIVWGADAAGPSDGDRGVAALGVGESGLVVSILPAAVDLN